MPTLERGERLHGTTILAVRHKGHVVMAGDGQVSMGQTVVKRSARKVRRLFEGKVLAGFAGGTADALTLFEKFEAKLEQYHGNLKRAAVELAKDWRSDRVLRRLEALLVVADRDVSLLITGNGDVIEPDDGLLAIGSGGNFALAAARALARALRARRARHRGGGDEASPRRSASTPTRRSSSRSSRPRRTPMAERLPQIGRSDSAERVPMTPREIVSELDRYIVGQRAAKRAVAIALRNRWRRQQVAEDLRDEIAPKNIIMIGPTGRRQDRDRAPARQARAGAVPQGRGLEVHRGRLRRPRRRVDDPRPDRAGGRAWSRRRRRRRSSAGRASTPRSACSISCCRRVPAGSVPKRASGSDRDDETQGTREKLRRMLREGKLDDRLVDVEVSAGVGPMLQIMLRRAWRRSSMNLKDMFANLMPKKTKRRRLKVAEAHRAPRAGGGRTG